MRPQILLVLITFLPALVFATHNRGGEIVVRTTDCADPSQRLTACATIVTYTEIAQTEVDRDSLLLEWGDGTSEMIARTRVTALTPGIQRNEYTLCHRYAAFGRYLLTFQDVNRVRGLRNIPGSVNIPFSVFTSFSLVDPALGSCNSTPRFTQHPIDPACIGSVWTHNPGAYDVDGDSLAFEFGRPTVGGRAEIPNYALPNQIGGATGDLTIDPRSGQITWDAPSAAGEYNLTILAISFRNGLPLDTLLRDLQIFVADCTNAPPTIGVDREEISVVAGEVVEFEVLADNPTSEDQSVSLTAGGRPFELTDNAATFLPAGGNLRADSTQKVFRWATTSADVSSQEYFVVLRAEDDGPPAPTGLATLRTVSIRVVASPPTAVAEVDPTASGGMPVSVYPNPTTDRLKVTLPAGAGDCDLTLYSPAGRRLRGVSGVRDRHTFSLAGLPVGAYFLVVSRGGRSLGRRRVMVQR